MIVIDFIIITTFSLVSLGVVFLLFPFAVISRTVANLLQSLCTLNMDLIKNFRIKYGWEKEK